MSKYSTQLAGILVREFFGPTTASVVDVLLRNGRLPLQAICRSARLPEKTVSEALTVLIQHGLVRWASVEEGPVDRTFYECFFEDIYPLVRYGKAIQMTEKITGSMEAGSLLQYILMQGRQKIKDIIAALTDPNDVDYQIRLKSLHKTLTTLLNQQYLRTVNWWNLMPSDDLVQKISLEEEKKLRGSGTTSAGMTSKTIKEAGKAAEMRLKSMKQDDKHMESLKRKPEEEIDVEAYHKSKRRRRVLDDDDEEQQQFTWNDEVTIAVDHRKFPLLVRDAELVTEVHYRLGPATAEIYRIVLEQVQVKLNSAREDVSEVGVLTSEIAQALPDPSNLPYFQDLVNPVKESSMSNGIPNSRRLGRKAQNYLFDDDGDDDEAPEVKINGIHRNPETLLLQKVEIVSQHLQSLADDSPVFIRSANGSQKSKDDEEWIVNLLSLQQYVRHSELERIIERKYGEDALRLVNVVAEKHHIDQPQFEKLILLKNKDIRVLLPQLHSGGILEVVEIPKAGGGLDRANNYNLWSFHESRARAFLLQDLYKTLIKIYQRIDEERARRQGILTKAQRTDVKKDLKRYLSRDELKQYAEWRDLEERLLGQIMRVDKSIMLLRDV